MGRALRAGIPAISSWAAAAAWGSREAHPDSPHRGGEIVPSRPITTRVGSRSSRHHVTSVMSPNVQIMAIPVPFSGSASSCATIGTSAPNSGVTAVRPTRARYRSSVGFATSATHAGISSGREVSISTQPCPSAMSNRTRW